MKKRLGLISDTHDHFDPQLPELFRDVDLILHAGDIGSREVLHRLSAIAPVGAVRGNIDVGGDCDQLPDHLLLMVDQVSILVTHIFAPPAPDVAGDAPRGARIVLFGHTHQQYLESHQGVLYFNPATAGSIQPRQPRSVGLLEIADGQVRTRHLPLK